jgi:hypothetical protein
MNFKRSFVAPVLATWKARSKPSKSGGQFPKQFQVYHRGNGKMFERMLQVASTGFGPPYLGHGSTVHAPAGSSGVVAGLLSFCASPCLAAGSPHAPSRTRVQPSGATLPTAYSCHGSWQNHPTMDGARGPLVPFVAAFPLRATEARWGAVSCHGEMGEGASRSTRMEPHSRMRWSIRTAY